MVNKKIPTLRAVMTPFPHQVDGQVSVKQAKQKMAEKDVRHLVVAQDNEFESIVSERDLQHASSIYGAENDDEIVVADICPQKVVIADINDPLDVILDGMAEQHLGSVVVLKEGELAGIFTTTDACYHFAKLLRELNKELPDIVA